MPAILEVMQSRIGIAEIRGKKHNPIIVQWFADVGHPEVQDDETAHCSACIGSAAIEAGLPTPPHNVVLMARSWLTWGVKVPLTDIQPGDVAIWARGDPQGWQGHVNVVETVNPDGTIVCVGGNQSTGKGYDAVTRTKPLSAKGALGFRRPVPATIKALRAAGSTTIKSADTEEKLGIVGIAVVPIVEGVKTLFEGAPNLSSVAGLTYWETMGKVANSCVSYALAHPWLAAILIVSIGMWVRSRITKRERVAEHAAGIPIAAEVAKMEAA